MANEPGILDAVKSIGGVAKGIYNAPEAAAKAMNTVAAAPAENEAETAAREARQAGQSALQDAIDRGMGVNKVPSQLAPIAGTELGK